MYNYTSLNRVLTLLGALEVEGEEVEEEEEEEEEDEDEDGVVWRERLRNLCLALKSPDRELGFEDLVVSEDSEDSLNRIF